MKRAKIVFGDENELYWMPLDDDFCNASKYAGEGGIAHVLMYIEKNKKSD